MAKKGEDRFAERMRIRERQLRRYRYLFEHPNRRDRMIRSWKQIHSKIYGRRS